MDAPNFSGRDSRIFALMTPVMLADGAAEATMDLSARPSGRAHRRQHMVRDLERFLAIQVGGWPRKPNRSGQTSTETSRAFAST